MSARLPTHLAVGALLRRVNDGGGMAVVRASGEAQSGAVLVLLCEGRSLRAVERMRGIDDRDVLIAAGPSDGDSAAVEDYWRLRRRRDPDLWVIELDVPDAERFVAETMLVD
ncbi:MULTISPECIES: DUF1491 family protein [unclassified Sphingomonas]|uniref:DUF1491 family protein n=1 Tax=unclassified Sphingomonas TaxID=196159 RepID=UPI00161CEE1D|nr:MULTISPECIES: DUF1491 family protein [unclassified Sphingomonas]MBB3348126.1 hypothetical protein [Sphingomonas sp. BK069]MBB3473793.1 hypothetical protein [Sphingomonas sp. BK345]